MFQYYVAYKLLFIIAFMLISRLFITVVFQGCMPAITMQLSELNYHHLMKVLCLNDSSVGRLLRLFYTLI